jgi:hypothetical protein
VTRTAILLWSAATGFLIGLIGGVALLAALTLVVNLVPGLPGRLVERLRVPALVLLLAVVPVAAAVMGYIEGRSKLP